MTSSPPRITDEAYVTMATTDEYAVGALVLAASLRATHTRRQLVVMVPRDTVSAAMREKALPQLFDLVHEVDVRDSGDAQGLALLRRPDLGVTFTKLHCWTLTQFSRAVWMDADTHVCQNIDELFDALPAASSSTTSICTSSREEQQAELAAVPDPGWSDCFNSGVFVFRPSLLTHSRLIEASQFSQASFDGADQGLLNTFFAWPKWRAISCLFNCCAPPPPPLSSDLGGVGSGAASPFYTFPAAHRRFRAQIRVRHFAGSSIKPWSAALRASSLADALCASGGSGGGGAASDWLLDALVLWLNTFVEEGVRTLLSESGLDALASRIEHDLTAVLPDSRVLERFSLVDSDWAKQSSHIFIGERGGGADGEAGIATAVRAGEDGDGGKDAAAMMQDEQEKLRRKEAEAARLQRQSWERGNADYLGDDRFEHIQQHLDKILEK